MAICYHCEKHSMLGRSHTHKRGVAGGRWKKRAPKTQRIFRANIQSFTIVEKGHKKSVRLCAKCVKRIRYDMDHGERPFLQLFQPAENPNDKIQITNKIQNPKSK